MSVRETPERNLKRVRDALDRYRVTSGKRFDLEAFATKELPDGLSQSDGPAMLAASVERLSTLQELFYAKGSWSLLIILQGMDASGKDSTIKHVMSGVNPQGVTVTSFKAPTPQERAHGFLWRVSAALPARGRIGLFNRSHYEDVLVPRVHADVLAASSLPPNLIDSDDFWQNRIADIAAFEGYLGRQGTRVVKIFLNISRDEQKDRLLERLDDPDKTWKFDAADLAERARWADYQNAYQAAIAGTATPTSPWYIVPADRKWYARLVVAEAVIQALDSFDLRMPKVSADERETFERARAVLVGE